MSNWENQNCLKTYIKIYKCKKCANFCEINFKFRKKKTQSGTPGLDSFPRHNLNRTMFLVDNTVWAESECQLAQSCPPSISKHLLQKECSVLLTNKSFLILCMIHPDGEFVMCDLTYHHFQCLVCCYELLKSTVGWVWISQYLVHFIGIVASGRSSHKLFCNTYQRYHNRVCHKGSTLREKMAVINLNE